MKTGFESTWDLPETPYELPCHKDHLFTLDGEYERNLKVVGEKFLIYAHPERGCPRKKLLEWSSLRGWGMRHNTIWSAFLFLFLCFGIATWAAAQNVRLYVDNSEGDDVSV